MDTIELNPGDPCPNCGSALAAAPEPTAEMRRRAEDREQRVPFPPYYDPASAAQRAELGALHACPRCGYQTRFPVKTAKAAAKAKAAEV